jgi:para-aminobenzoate synthetase/4-amino-4-deoxychorismate lyase
VIFVDPEGFVTEGSFTTVFVERGGQLLTPPLSRGLLPGILRERLLADGRAVKPTSDWWIWPTGSSSETRSAG